VLALGSCVKIERIGHPSDYILILIAIVQECLESFTRKLRLTSIFVFLLFANLQEMLLKCPLLDIYRVLLILQGFILLNLMRAACRMLVAILLHRKEILDLLKHARLSSRLLNLFQFVLLMLLVLFLWRHFLSFPVVIILL
jgi:hypothetical protein